MRQCVAQGLRRALIEENAHLCGGKRASGSVIEHSPRLVNCDAGKPFDELQHKRAIFKILEKR